MLAETMLASLVLACTHVVVIAAKNGAQGVSRVEPVWISCGTNMIADCQLCCGD